jgi:hypothetical protein
MPLMFSARASFFNMTPDDSLPLSIRITMVPVDWRT